MHCCDRTDEVVFDVDLTFQGLVKFVLNTTYTPIETSVGSVSFKKQFNLDLTIKVSEIVAIMRFCYHPYGMGKPWWTH